MAKKDKTGIVLAFVSDVWIMQESIPSEEMKKEIQEIIREVLGIKENVDMSKVFPVQFPVMGNGSDSAIGVVILSDVDSAERMDIKEKIEQAFEKYKPNDKGKNEAEVRVGTLPSY